MKFQKWLKLKEMASFSSIVSCKDLKNPNFQVQGSLSNLDCGENEMKKEKEIKKYKLTDSPTIKEPKKIPMPSLKKEKEL